MSLPCTSGPPSASAHGQPAREPVGARPPLLDSARLFQGHPTVEIIHQGVLYRLQATRLGKLILTK